MRRLTFCLTNEITRPDFRRNSPLAIQREKQRRAVMALDGHEQIAWDYRGRWLGEGWAEGVRDSVGTIISQALIEEDMDTAYAGARVWVHNHHLEENWSNVLTQGLMHLDSKGRMDLFRPVLSLLAQTALDIWRDTQSERQTLDEAFRGDKPPRMDESLAHAAADFLSFISEAGLFRGAGALQKLGDELTYIIGHVASIKPCKDETITAPQLSVVVDAACSVEDVHPWLGNMFLEGLSYAVRVADAPVQKALRSELEPLMDFLTDSEAAAVLRRLADWNTQEQPEDAKLVKRLIGKHPHLTLEGWLTHGVPGEMFNTGTGGRSGRAVCQLREDLFDPQNQYVSETHQPTIAQSYETMISWIGAQQGDEMSEWTHDVLSRLASATAVKSIALPNLRSALDRWTLVHETTQKPERTKKATSGSRRAM